MFNCSWKTQKYLKYVKDILITASQEIGNWLLRNRIIWDMKNLKTEEPFKHRQIQLALRKVRQRSSTVLQEWTVKPLPTFRRGLRGTLFFWQLWVQNLIELVLLNFHILKYLKEFCLSFVNPKLKHPYWLNQTIECLWVGQILQWILCVVTLPFFPEFKLRTSFTYDLR